MITGLTTFFFFEPMSSEFASLMPIIPEPTDGQQKARFHDTKSKSTRYQPVCFGGKCTTVRELKAGPQQRENSYEHFFCVYYIG